MEVVTFLFVIALIWFFYNQGIKEGENSEKRRAFNAKMDKKYPFILKKYEVVTAQIYTKGNCSNLEEAHNESLRAISKSDLGFIHAEKVEIWNKGKLLETHYTKERLPINKIDGFAFHKYNGEVKPENHRPFDPESIGGYGYMKIILTNGDTVSLTKPMYSLRTNSLMGKFWAEFHKNNSLNPSEFRVIPLRVIDKVLSYG